MLAEFNANEGAGASLLFAIVCAVIAPGRGRSALAWFFLGLLFNCFALLFLVLLPNLRDDAAKAAHTDQELHRLREQIKKERFVADQRDEHTQGRLNVHDRALGIDTKATPPPPALGDAEPLYFFTTGEKQLGPIPRSQLRRLCLDAEIADKTLVWCEGMTDWMPFHDVPELADDD